MCFKKACMGLMVVCLMLSAGLVLANPPKNKAADAESGVPLALAETRGEIQHALESMNASLSAAARDLAGEKSLDTTRVHAILGKLCADAPRAYVVDCCTVDLSGKIVAMEPEIYKLLEGADISRQEQIVRLHKTGQPVLSLTIPMVEGFEAVDLEWPIKNETGALKGSVSMLIKPAALIAAAARPVIEGLPVSIWAMEKNGHILYDVHPNVIGRNLFTDPLIKPFEQLRAMGRKIASEPDGSGFYELSKPGSAVILKKQVYWMTAGLHGTDWRLVMAQAVAGDKRAEASAAGLPSVLPRLHVLASNGAFQRFLTAGNGDALMRIFERFFRANPGLYAIEWIDADGVVQFGYPPENSLHHYNMRASDSPLDRQFMEAVDSREEATLDLALHEGNSGTFYLAPVMHGKRYLGTVYAIRPKPESQE